MRVRGKGLGLESVRWKDLEIDGERDTGREGERAM